MSRPPATLPTVILIVRSGCGLNEAAAAAVRDALDLRHVLESADHGSWEPRLDGMEGRFVLNFLSDRILKGAVLERDAVNFHPAPPEYPGRCTASYALFDGAGEFGATAHRMAATPDSGAILMVRRFPIVADEGCDVVARQAEEACLDLLHGVSTHIGQTGALPPPNGETWRREPFTRKQFEDWLVLDPADPATFEKKVRAARHPRYPGPYVIVNGHRFSLDES